MKNNLLKFWLIGGMVVGLLGSLAPASVTDMPYRPFYWIVGQVPDSGSIKADGRIVVFYKDDETYNTNNAQAVIQNNRFMINAFYIYPLELKVGETYKVAIVKGADGWGADPVDITISGKGYDVVSATATGGPGTGPDGTPGTGPGGAEFGGLFFRNGGGLAKKPEGGGGEPPVEVVYEPSPTVKIWFGNRVYQKGLVAKGEKFVISPQPEIRIEVSIPEPFSLSQNLGEYSIVLDQGTAAAKTLTLTAQTQAQSVKAQADAVRSMNLQYTISETETLPEGAHTLAISAKSSGKTGVASIVTEAVTVEVLGGPLRMVGTPITFPSPFSISKQGTVYIQYTLSSNANLEIYLVSVGGERIKRFTLNSGSEGGSAGVNKVSWDGRADQGYLAGNAIYVGTILARDEGRLLGKFKLTIVD